MRLKWFAFFGFCLPFLGFSQFLQQKEFKWDDNFVDYKELPDSLKSNDAVILREYLQVERNSIYRRVAIKILTPKGLSDFKKIQLPENFDLTNYPNFNLQGRFKDRCIPNLNKFQIHYFAARIITPNKNIVDLPSEFNVENIYWVNSDGKRIDDKIYNFKTDVLDVGDILEYTYYAGLNSKGIQNIIYPHGPYPKLNYTLKVDWPVINKYSRKPTIYHFDYLEGINYRKNIPVGLSLPNIQINYPPYSQYSFTNILYNRFEFQNNGFKYTWNSWLGSLYRHDNDNYHLSIRKFIAQFEESKKDTFKLEFLKQLLDTINTLNYLTPEESHYRNITGYVPSFPDIFYKRNIAENDLLRDLENILAESKISFYDGIIVDKRYSAVNPDYRSHIAMETPILVFRYKKGFKYIVPRYNGLKYVLDELPFYFEGTNCILFTYYSGKSNEDNKSRIISTPISTYNENVRTESALFKIKIDSLTIAATIKENLKGQFSTILRHLYNNENIDSTINKNYFVKCTEKPMASDIKIISGAESEYFPISHSYRCTENIKLNSGEIIDLNNWFSFTFKKEYYKEIPSHDFYFDFQYSDIYNFMFEFDKETKVLNEDELTKNLNNDYFEVISNIAKKDTNRYLVSVSVKIKKYFLPKKEGKRLVEFVNLLDEINHFKLLLKY